VERIEWPTVRSEREGVSCTDAREKGSGTTFRLASWERTSGSLRHKHTPGYNECNSCVNICSFLLISTVPFSSNTQCLKWPIYEYAGVPYRNFFVPEFYSGTCQYILYQFIFFHFFWRYILFSRLISIPASLNFHFEHWQYVLLSLLLSSSSSSTVSQCT
jgi:hypothetical protein